VTGFLLPEPAVRKFAEFMQSPDTLAWIWRGLWSPRHWQLNRGLVALLESVAYVPVNRGYELGNPRASLDEPAGRIEHL